MHTKRDKAKNLGKMSTKENIGHQDFSKDSFDQLDLPGKMELFVQNYRVPQKRSKQEALELLRTKMNQTSARKQTVNLRIYLSAAASIALIALLTTVYFYFTPNQIVAARGEHVEYALPDGSNVTVNADSKIAYSKSKFKGDRTLSLEGEAFFSVQKGKPFVVRTKLGNVEVLGTTLNVFARGKEFNVSCLTGKVRVSVNGSSETILPGETVELISGVLKKTTNIPTDELASWRNGQFHFDNMPLISIFDEIERQFNVRITTKGIENRFYTGTFSNKNLAEVLETVCSPMNLDYEIKNGSKITVRPKTK
jgi:transmembrane sensor